MNDLTLEACPTMFDNIVAILENSGCSFSLLSSNNLVRGVRQKETACYDITRGTASVQLWMERRLGNPTMFFSIGPVQASCWRPDPAADQLAQHIAELLIASGAEV